MNKKRHQISQVNLKKGQKFRFNELGTEYEFVSLRNYYNIDNCFDITKNVITYLYKGKVFEKPISNNVKVWVKINKE